RPAPTPAAAARSRRAHRSPSGGQCHERRRCPCACLPAASRIDGPGPPRACGSPRPPAPHTLPSGGRPSAAARRSQPCGVWSTLACGRRQRNTPGRRLEAEEDSRRAASVPLFAPDSLLLRVRLHVFHHLLLLLGAAHVLAVARLPMHLHTVQHPRQVVSRGPLTERNVGIHLRAQE